MRYARLTQRALDGDERGWNYVMAELAEEIRAGRQPNRFSYTREVRYGSTYLVHPFFGYKNSDGRPYERAGDEVGWNYKPEQWEDIGLESEAEEL